MHELFFKAATFRGQAMMIEEQKKKCKSGTSFITTEEAPAMPRMMSD